MASPLPSLSGAPLNGAPARPLQSFRAGRDLLKKTAARLALSAALAMAPMAAQAQSREQISLIRDTEIEAILRADSERS